MADTLVDLYDVTTSLRIVGPEKKYHEELNQLIENCSGAILDRLDPRDIYKQTYTNEYHDIERDTYTIFTKQYPVVSITSITEDGTTLVEDTSYKIHKDLGRIHKINISGTTTFEAGKKVICITYTAGYSKNDIPKGLKQACLDLIYFKFYHRDGGAIQQVTFEGSRSGSGIVKNKMIRGLPENVFYAIQTYIDTRVP